MVCLFANLRVEAVSPAELQRNLKIEAKQLRGRRTAARAQISVRRDHDLVAAVKATLLPPSKRGGALPSSRALLDLFLSCATVVKRCDPSVAVRMSCLT